MIKLENIIRKSKRFLGGTIFGLTALGCSSGDGKGCNDNDDCPKSYTCEAGQCQEPQLQGLKEPVLVIPDRFIENGEIDISDPERIRIDKDSPAADWDWDKNNYLAGCKNNECILRQIIRVQDGLIITDRAYLGDIISDANVQIPLSFSNLSTIHAPLTETENLPLNYSKAYNIPLNAEFGIIDLKGNLETDLNLELSYEFRRGELTKAALVGEGGADLELTISAEVFKEWEKELPTIEIANLTSIFFTPTFPPIPVSLHGVLSLTPKASAKGELSLSSEINGSLDIYFELYKHGDKDWKNYENTTFEANLKSPQIESAGAYLKAQIQADLSLLIYNLLGPKLSITPAIGANVMACEDPQLKIYTETALGAGMNLGSILGSGELFSVDLYSKRWDLYEKNLLDLNCGDAPQICEDECKSYGDGECIDGKAVTCTDFDSDPCLEWSEPEDCPKDELCKSGRCRSETIDECATGCPTGYSCENNRCVEDSVTGGNCLEDDFDGNELNMNCWKELDGSLQVKDGYLYIQPGMTLVSRPVQDEKICPGGEVFVETLIEGDGSRRGYQLYSDKTACLVGSEEIFFITHKGFSENVGRTPLTTSGPQTVLFDTKTAKCSVGSEEVINPPSPEPNEKFFMSTSSLNEGPVKIDYIKIECK